ncbi:MAG: TIGR02099 family protein [Burkholderiales bacterium]|nr:TIGR02099 family protein [Burkholderiales bacterium]
MPAPRPNMTGDASTTAPAAEERTLFAIRVLRRLAWVLVGVWFVVAALILAVRYFVLPNADAYKDDVAALLSRAVGEKVTVGRIDAAWHGLHPYLSLADVRLHDRAGAVALSLPSIDASVGWRSLLAWELRFHALAFDAPDLKIRRDNDGRIFIAGIELPQSESPDGSLADWLLRQGEVVLRDGRIEWLDEKRGAPLLVLSNVGFRLTNRFNDHSFAISATPPAALASKLDLRGQLEGDSFQELQAWTGKLFADVDYVDLAAWTAWLDYPFEVNGGSGALRAWLSFATGRLTEAVADVGLTNVQTRLAADLPMLDVDSLSGRFGARETQKGSGFFAFIGKTQPGYEVFGERLAFGLRGEPALRPTDFRLRWQPKAGGKEGAGEFRADAVELEPLAALVERLPFPANVRRTLSDSEPRGTLRDVLFNWEGPAEEPTRFAARGQFEGFALKARGGLPGFSGIAGSFGVNEASGSVTLQSKASAFDYPDVLSGGPIALDSIAGRVTWSRPGGAVEAKLDNVAVSGPEVAATFSGVYRQPVGGHGEIDLTVRGTRVAGRAAYKFIPHLSPLALEWLRSSITAGGDVANFPFDDPASGAFELALKVSDVALDIGEGWPKFERVSGDLAFEGRRMTLANARGTTTGVPVTGVKGRIPDLFAPVTLLEIEGQAEGPTDAFLRYVETSPVKDMTERFTVGMRAEGRGKLALKLELPLEQIARTTVAGSYQFLANTIHFEPGEPPATQVNGTLAFTEQGMSARGITGQVLGGPFTLSAATREGIVQASAQGTAAVGDLAGFLDAPTVLAGRLQGSLGYAATARLRGRIADVTVESDLVGVAIDLPAPFGKSAQESWPTRVERTVTAGTDPAQRRDNLTAQVGQLLALNAQFRQEGGHATLDRAALAVGASSLPQLPRTPGVALAVTLAELDYDRLSALLPGGRDAERARLEAMHVKVGRLTAGGKLFHDVDARVRFAGERMQISVASREATGDVEYDARRGGSVHARLKQFAYPDPAPSAVLPAETARELPGLDVIAESFTFHGHALGRLELEAVNEGADWRIRRLALIAPEGSAKLEGLARPAGAAALPRTDISFAIEVKDIGAYLNRIGLSGVIARGDASLTGNAAWQGPVYEIDYPTLNGNLVLRAENGQFLKVKPGIGKLLGVLSLQSLGRRLTLDFRDVFGEGFAFDTITATASISKGIAKTSDFAMTGPSAGVTITGTANLASETQDLRVRVVPSIGDSAAVAAGLALVNPVIGLGALVAQRVLKDPIGQMLAFEYQVTGSWDDPKVERLRLPEVAGETPIPREQAVPGVTN